MIAFLATLAALTKHRYDEHPERGLLRAYHSAGDTMWRWFKRLLMLILVLAIWGIGAMFWGNRQAKIHDDKANACLAAHSHYEPAWNPVNPPQLIIDGDWTYRCQNLPK